MKFCFLGTPDYTLRLVKELHKRGVLKAIVSKPEKSLGRGLEKRVSLLKDFAKQHKLIYLETEDINSCKEFFQLDIDYLFVFSFAQFLKENILKTYPCVNLHLSLLPQFRGASPVHYALWQGLKETGWTLQQMVKKMDAGNILFQNKVSIYEETVSTLIQKLVFDFIETSLEDFLKDPLKKGLIQDESQVTFAPTIKKEQGEIFFQKQTAKEIYHQFQAFCEWPGIFFKTSLGPLKIKRGSLIHEDRDDLLLRTQEGIFYIHEIIPPGKKSMRPGAYLRGIRLDPIKLLQV